LRPGVVWFGEPLPLDTIAAIDAWIEAGESVDLILVIGTTATVWPANTYVDIARR
jgi:NAD-dependent deacetylase sirtuin 5